VAVKIKLKRMGKIHAPYYRIIVADARTKRDGRAIEEIGKYHPKAEPSLIEVDSARAQHWLSVGAQPTDPVRKILEITGDWQKFKDLPGAEGTLKTAEPKASKKDLFAAVVAETLGAGGGASQKGKAKKPAAKGAEGDQSEASAAKAGAGKQGKAAGGGKTAHAEAPEAGAKADAGTAEAKAGASKADKAGGGRAGAGKADKTGGGRAGAGKADAKASTANADGAGAAEAGPAEAAEAAAESGSGA
jgi:small subunit ribosomal protein S16